MRKLFGLHIWKSGPKEIECWKQVEHGAKILTKRYETPEEYAARKKDMVTMLLFGKLFTFKIPWLYKRKRERK